MNEAPEFVFTILRVRFVGYRQPTDMKKLILSLLLVASFNLTAAAQNYNFQHYTTAEGLPNNTIICCIQDKMGFIWIGTRDGVSLYDGYNFLKFSGEDKEGILRGKILIMYQDSKERIWFSTANGTGYFDPYTNSVKRVFSQDSPVYYSITEDAAGNIWMSSTEAYAKVDGATGQNSVFDARMDQSSQSILAEPEGKNHIWMASDNGRINRIDTVHGECEEFEIFDKSDRREGEHPVRIVGYKNEYILISTNHNRIVKFNTADQTYCTIFANTSLPIINYIKYESSRDLILIGTQNGLLVCTEKSGIQRIIQDSNEFELSNANITCITPDQEGDIWVGTFHGGINMLQDENDALVHYISSPNNADALHGKIIRAIAEDDSGNIWAGSEDGYLSRIRKSGNKIDNFSNIGVHNYQCLIQVGDEIWAGTFGDGIIILDRKDGILKKQITVPGQSCISLLRTSGGDILAGTSKGLLELDDNGEFRAEFPELKGKFIHALFEDSRSNIWAGVFGDGLWKKSKSDRNFRPIIPSMPGKCHFSNYISSLSEDNAGNLWISTEGSGILRMPIDNPENTFQISEENGLPSNIACASLADKNGTMWISTSRGLASMKIDSDQIENTYIDQLKVVNSSFFYNSSAKSASGELYFGALGGMVSFKPENINRSSNNAPLFITEISTSNRMNAKSITEPGKTTIGSRKIKIKARDASVLRFSFATPNYSKVQDITYECILKKGNKVSKSVSRQNYIVYNNLRRGKYIFHVRILGEDSPGAAREVQLKVIPPVLVSSPAIMLYILFLSALIAAIIWQGIKTRQNKAALERNRQDAIKQKELYDAKSTFFTNLTHEIRTPLTLIKLPLDKIIEHKEYTDESKEDILTIKANTDRLLSLTNQYLDIKKIQNNEISINYSYTNIYAFINKVCKYFEPAIKERHLTYNLNIPTKSENISADTDKVEKILCNILSNAIKYCKSAIDVEASYDEKKELYVIRITSDGERISEDNVEKIFEPYYQIKTINSQLIGSSGTGLGLPYARSLARAMGGDLYLDDKVREKNSFVFTLVGKAVPSVKESLQIDESNAEAHPSGQSTVLFVDDAKEMCEYISKELSGSYKVLTASNGEEAMKILGEEKIDIVISDIMMPIMDGCQLCNQIKSNLEYCHIPVILLTAAIGVDTRIATLEVGADGYIEKPFEIALLKANISNLFMNREISYRQFTDSPLSHFSTTVVNNKLDQQFMEKLHNVVMENIADEDLSSEKLSELVCTSKSTLYRKVKANTGQNINEYIRLCRLKRASEMLASQKYRINEVAYLCGFASASYFATCFLKQFNISPSNFVKGLKPKDEQ